MPTDSPFTLVCGPDDFRVVRRAGEHWEQLTEGIDDEYAREIVDGQAGNLSDAEEALARFISAVQTMPMFGDRKAVWFRNISFMGDTRPGGTEGAKAIIAKLQETLGGLRAGEVGVLLSASPFSRRSRKTVDWWKKEWRLRIPGCRERRISRINRSRTGSRGSGGHPLPRCGCHAPREDQRQLTSRP